MNTDCWSGMISGRSTQNYNIEAEDPALFLANARDAILRYRNHPSIAVWCGRNEGVPQPIINEGLAALINSLDGTRYYSPSSNQINLQNSGPYKYQDPKLYYTTLNRGFSVETGTPSMSTLESFQCRVCRKRINGPWTMRGLITIGISAETEISRRSWRRLQAEFGAPTSLEDFERKAQMLNYVNHRAIFEGMNAHLWAPNSARMLWMTQPAWPSTMWQILDSRLRHAGFFLRSEEGLRAAAHSAGSFQLRSGGGEYDSGCGCGAFAGCERLFAGE